MLVTLNDPEEAVNVNPLAKAVCVKPEYVATPIAHVPETGVPDNEPVEVTLVATE